MRNSARRIDRFEGELHPMTDFRETLRGIVAMLLCCLFFLINDTIVKAVAEDLPIGEVLFIRSLIATLVVFVVVWRMGLLPRVLPETSRFVITRSICEGLATVVYLSGLVHLPIANASAISQAAPANCERTSTPGSFGSCAATYSLATRFMPSRSGVTSPTRAAA